MMENQNRANYDLKIEDSFFSRSVRRGTNSLLRMPLPIRNGLLKKQFKILSLMSIQKIRSKCVVGLYKGHRRESCSSMIFSYTVKQVSCNECVAKKS